MPDDEDQVEAVRLDRAALFALVDLLGLGLPPDLALRGVLFAHERRALLEEE